MDINFPLIMLIAVSVTGAVWLLDIVLLAPRRRAAGAQHSPEVSLEASTEATAHKGLKEPLLVEYSKSFFPVLLIVLLLRSFLVEPFQIPSASMEPTLTEGDFILVNKYHYGLRLPVFRNKVLSINEPKRGDIMVFFPPHDTRYFIKRVIGLPGDRIRFENKLLYINDELMPQEFIASYAAGAEPFQLYKEDLGGVEHEVKRTLNVRSVEGVWEVPEGHYFMMGDNRENSSDSRRWQSVPEENIVGKAFAIWIHKKPDSFSFTFNRNRFLD